MKAEEKRFNFKMSTKKLTRILIKASPLRVDFEINMFFFPDSIRKSKGTLS